MPFASSHLVSQECRQHASRPNHVMSPLGNARYLSGRCSRERHCDRVVIPFPRRFLFLCFGHFASTSLFPFAPPRFATRLPRYYENSVSCRVASSGFPDIAMFVLFRRAIFRREPGPLVTQRPALRNLTGSSSTPSHDRSPCLSRLNF